MSPSSSFLVLGTRASLQQGQQPLAGRGHFTRDQQKKVSCRRKKETAQSALLPIVSRLGGNRTKERKKAARDGEGWMRACFCWLCRNRKFGERLGVATSASASGRSGRLPKPWWPQSVSRCRPSGFWSSRFSYAYRVPAQKGLTGRIHGAHSERSRNCVRSTAYIATLKVSRTCRFWSRRSFWPDCLYKTRKRYRLPTSKRRLNDLALV